MKSAVILSPVIKAGIKEPSQAQPSAVPGGTTPATATRKCLHRQLQPDKSCESQYLTSTNRLFSYGLSSYWVTLKGLFLALKIAAFISEEQPERFSVFFPTIAFVVGDRYDIFKEAERELCARPCLWNATPEGTYIHI